jgi:hypothetical protein
MQGTVCTLRRKTRIVLVCVALLIVSACGEDGWRAPGAPTPPPVTSTPPPIASAPPPAAWEDLGDYTLTMTAAASCSLPDYGMAQTYDMRVKERGHDLVVELVDQPHCVSWGWPCGFTGTRDAEAVRFTLNGDYPADDGYVFDYEVDGEHTALAYKGTATGTLADNSITAMLDGDVRLYACNGFCAGKEFARCDAPDHRMVLVRK